ncbi:hypothetical protein EJ02DRAFT_349496 [Clathrospora elynae]|uniref:Stc1 domain-containing protein n=1 Tax=Clathrospora elynae TaxID=706981 RepID=A0A6A5SLY2_9PLEO|nr:hypothetical protein EJ02DRAFT_349496 [Clathrospora elynae]
MAGRKHQVHAYSPDEIDRLKNVRLPKRIKCGRCFKNLPQAKYSIKQLTDARWQITNNGKFDKPINCQACTGQQIVELECVMCGKTQGLESFAKSQRNKPDTAKCFKCVEEQLSVNAIDEEKYEDGQKAFLPPEHSNGHFPEYFSSATSTTDSSSTYGDDEWSSINGKDPESRSNDQNGGVALSEGFQRAMSINGSTDDTLAQFEYAYPPGRFNNGSEARTKSWHTQSNAAPSASSCFNPNAYGRPSATSVASSSHSFRSSVAERSDASDIRPNGWAKIRAYRSPSPKLTGGPPTRPAGDNVREQESAVNAWDSDEDEDEVDDDDNDDDSDDDTII